MQFNRGLPSNLYFWRDREGHEVDVLVEKADTLVPIEIKSGQTVNADSFRGLDYWNQCNESESLPSWLVYGGREKHTRRTTAVLGWPGVGELSRIVT